MGFHKNSDYVKRKQIARNNIDCNSYGSVIYTHITQTHTTHMGTHEHIYTHTYTYMHTYIHTTHIYKRTQTDTHVTYGCIHGYTE